MHQLPSLLSLHHIPFTLIPLSCAPSLIGFGLLYVTGTTLFLFFGGYCSTGPHSKLPPEHPDHKNCLKRFDMKEVPNVEAAEKLWRDYFVFTVSRNPYSRAGSAYDYML